MSKVAILIDDNNMSGGLSVELEPLEDNDNSSLAYQVASLLHEQVPQAMAPLIEAGLIAAPVQIDPDLISRSNDTKH